MNKQQIQYNRNNIKKRFVESGWRQNNRVNRVNLNSGNTWAHEELKCRICYELMKRGKHFYCECRLFNGRIADVLCLDDPCIYEICGSETDKELYKKLQKYPHGMPITRFKVGTEWRIIEGSL